MGGKSDDELYQDYKKSRDTSGNADYYVGPQNMKDKFEGRYMADSKVARQASDDERYNRLKGQAKADRDASMAEGRARGEAEFADQSLGRVDAERSGEISDLIAKRKERLGGYTPEEENAMRDQMDEQTKRGTQTVMRQVRGAQGSSGVRGGLAVAQQIQVANEGNKARAGVERDLAINKVAERSRALDSLDSTVAKARADELDRQKYNITQANKEKFGRLGTEMSYASLGSAESNAVMQRIIGENASADAKEMASKAGKK